MNLERPQIKITVCGSMNKFWNEMRLVIEEFRDLGANVLSPGYSELILPQKGGIIIPHQFAPLKYELGWSIKRIEDHHLAALARSDFGYWVCIDGQIGDSGCFEVGFAKALGIPFYISQQVNHNLLDPEMVLSSEVKKLKVAAPKEAYQEIITFCG